MPEKVPKRVDRMSHIYTVRKKKIPNHVLDLK